ncbi:hypothetical protein VOM14_07665 [Paraburkholderia sp. MPAMCS5]|uniref:hypothetical protein n=1 Tax=Paraburkholderia sp. MPAMCS5 TaxID=3112563 RepID=UPI002E196EE3|nr:hypothetical protein [Paraburkholderia sp. MPAMCS5]
MNTATNTASARNTVASNNGWLAKLRAAAVHALNLHLQNCAVIAEAHRRPQ